MVVPEEVNPDNTTTENAEKITSSSLTLDYNTSNSNIEEDYSPVDILSETEIKDDIPQRIEREPNKTVTFYEKKGIESGIEILYTSLKLKNFPIKESNLSNHEVIIEQLGLNSSTVHVGDIPLLNTSVKIISFKTFKIVEFKTREFKLALSIKFEGNTIMREGDYFRYEIFSKLKNSRLFSVAKIFKNIFSGTEIFFTINDLQGSIIFDNPIQAHKFGMIIESIKKYENIKSTLKISKNKYFSDTQMDFYTLHLLDNYLSGNTTLNSWINYRLENTSSIKAGDNLIFIKDHNLDFRGINYLLREKLVVKDKISENDINSQNNYIVGYRKLVEIQLEKIEK